MSQGGHGGPGAQGKPWPQPRVLSFSPAPRALRARGAVLLPCKISNFRGEFLRALIFLFPLKQLSYNASAARQVAALRSAVRRSAEARAVRASHRRSAAAWHCAAKHGMGRRSSAGRAEPRRALPPPGPPHAAAQAQLARGGCARVVRTHGRSCLGAWWLSAQGLALVVVRPRLLPQRCVVRGGSRGRGGSCLVPGLGIRPGWGLGSSGGGQGSQGGQGVHRGPEEALAPA